MTYLHLQAVKVGMELLNKAYDESAIKSLDWKEHIRLRPGMYIGKLGDGSSFEDGIYILLKEIVDNSIDEHTMGHGKKIEVVVANGSVRVRDFGRGIPFGKLVDCVSRINTGGKYDSGVFQKSVGLNGVGTKAVNALSSAFKVTSFRDGKARYATFSKGELLEEKEQDAPKEKNGTSIEFTPDASIFKNYHFIEDYVVALIKNYTYLNNGLELSYNGTIYKAENGLHDLLEEKVNKETFRYPIIHLRGADIEVAITHTDQYGEEIYSFVNGQNTLHGGTHLAAFREAFARVTKEFFKKDFDNTDVRASILAAVAIRVQEPVFESQTKTKLGSVYMSPEQDQTVKNFIYDFLKKALDDFLHKHQATADEMLRRIQQSERERKDIAGIRKLANDRAKKASLHNKKLRDCKLHLNEKGAEDKLKATTLFITEGDSASGSLTKSRNVETQAVFSLRGKPLNCFGESKKIVYQNEEFNLLQHALNIEEGLDNLRYQNIVIATDADVDGMHIRLLVLTFFLQFFPDLVRNGHVFILETPLFRVRNKKQTIYCYSEEEKQAAMRKLGSNPEITRFKGLGEISPDEFGQFIGENIRLEPILITNTDKIKGLLEYYMGGNTMTRQKHIIDNLRIEADIVDEELPLIEKAQGELEAAGL